MACPVSVFIKNTYRLTATAPVMTKANTSGCDTEMPNSEKLDDE